jgi:hypothetical protein
MIDSITIASHLFVADEAIAGKNRAREEED